MENRSTQQFMNFLAKQSSTPRQQKLRGTKQPRNPCQVYIKREIVTWGEFGRGIAGDVAEEMAIVWR